jgi:hypothetical protein
MGGKRITLQDCHEFAKAKGGQCLSKKYVKIFDKMLWSCGDGHIWEANYNNLYHNNY